MEISVTAALMRNVSGKILICKQWGAGYQWFNGNKHDKACKCTWKYIQRKLKL